jgi:hypothetical protein
MRKHMKTGVQSLSRNRGPEPVMKSGFQARWGVDY